MPFKYTGSKEVLKNLQRFVDKFPERLAAAVYQESQIEMTEAKQRTPVDITPNAPHPGQLRASGQVSLPQYEGSRVFCVLSFGGAASGYAWYVHENLNALHPVGQAKYLESTLRESEAYIGERIARRINLDEFVREIKSA
jgi:hypothetical protein